MAKDVNVKIKGDADFAAASRETQNYADRLEKAARKIEGIDGAKLGRNVSKGADKASSSWKNAAGKITGSMRRIGETAAGVLGANLIEAGARKAVELYGTAIDEASNLNEALSKSNAVFGQQAGQIEQFANTAADSLGLSKSAALDAAGGFGNMFDQLGFAGGQAAEMSTSIVELAADFASFNNADISDVIDAQSAAFRGEYDSLQRFLPLINAATVEQKALELSGKSATKELTAQEKALAVNALMFEGAGKAMGDFARTADESANAERRAAAEMANMRAELGQKLLPVQQKITEAKLKLANVLVDKLVPALDVIVPVILTVVDGFSTFISVLAGGEVEAGAGTFSRVMGGIATLITGTIVPGISAFIGFIGDLVDRFQSGDVTESGLVSSIRDFIGFVIDTAVPAIVDVAEKIIAAWENIGPEVVDIITQLAGVVGTAIELVVAVVSAAVAILMFIWRNWGDEIIAVARTAWDLISGVIQGALSIIQGIMNIAIGILTGDWSRAWDGIKQVFSGVWQVIQSLLRAGWAVIRGLFSAGAGVLKGIWNGLWGAVESFVKGAWSRITGGVRTGVSNVGSAVGRLPGVIRNHASRMWNAIYDRFKAVIDRIKSLWSKLSFKVPKVSIPGLGSVGGSIIRVATNLFADGNVAREPIAGIFGEYQGARHNPEITTPESLMAQVFRNELNRHGGAAGGAGINIEKVVVDERRSLDRELRELQAMHRLVGA